MLRTAVSSTQTSQPNLSIQLAGKPKRPTGPLRPEEGAEMYSSPAVVNIEFLRNFNGEATLDELAERVREAHATAQNIVANALAAIFAAGEALIAARSRVAEGGWQHWLRTHCFLSLSTAKLYIQITEHRGEIEAALEEDPNLSLRAARRLIAKPKNPPESSTKTDDQRPNLVPAGSNALDVLGWWSGASREQHQHFLEHVDLTDVLAALPSGWRPMLEARLSGHLSAPQLLDLLERRLERDGINAAALLQKLR